MRQDIKDYTLEELKDYLISKRFPSYYARQIFIWVYKKRVEDFKAMSDISKEARSFLEDNFYFSKLTLLKREASVDKTEKFLFELEDSHAIETVLIPEEKRLTLCLSTQVGCKFSCRFCLSGSLGFKRNLKASEIVEQYMAICDRISPVPITNIVFMGIGEPLDNLSNVVKAIKILMEPQGLYFGKRRICISTCGLIPKIRQLIELRLGVKLSISLHAATDEVRNRLMPINKRYHIQGLIRVAREYARKEKYPLTFEYILLKGINTTKIDAIRLARLLKGMKAKVNLISYNLGSSQFQPTGKDEIVAFTEELRRRNIFFTLRKSRGCDIKAACGQLRAHFLTQDKQ